MPVMKCKDGKFKIGKRGKCVYKDKATAERAYKGYLGAKHSAKNVSDALLEQDISLTPAEAKAMLDANIRRTAGFKISYPGDGDAVNKYTGLSGVALGIDADKVVLDKLATEVHDSLVSEFAYNDQLVKATRSVDKFNLAYVRRVIKAGLKSGAILAEAALCMADEMLEAFGKMDGSGKGKGQPGGGRRNKKKGACADGGPGDGKGGGRGKGKNR